MVKKCTCKVIQKLLKRVKDDSFIDLYHLGCKVNWNLSRARAPHLEWQIHHAYGKILEKIEKNQEADEHYAEAIKLIERTASQISDNKLRESLLSSPQIQSIRKTCARPY